MDVVKLKILNFFVMQHLDRASRFYYTLSVLGYPYMNKLWKNFKC